MVGPDANLFSAEFLDDYFAECEEHLMIVRKGLLDLEEYVNAPAVEPALLEELFRSFHSLKGISGMVGLKEAEQLAHEMEDYLRALRQRQVALSTEGVDGLVAGARMLEEVVGARRADQTPPDISAALAQLGGLVPGHRPEAKPAAATADGRGIASHASERGLTPEERGRLAAAVQNGARAWHFRFTPAAALAERGINVNTTRARLQELGELIHAAPLVTSEGIVFEFIVAARADEAAFDAGTGEGLTFKPYDPAPAPQQNGQAAVRQNGKGAPRQPGPSSAPTNLVRVDLTRLDELMRMVGDLVISRARLKDHLDRLEASLPPADWRALQETNLVIERQLRDLRGGVMRARMVPVGEVFERMRFVVRDLERESDKKIHLELVGRHTEIDKYLVERLMDPLLHLVRNAVAHGLEPGDERAARGKPPEGRLTLRAATAGETVLIEVEDDGRGLNLAEVETRARRAGLLGPNEALDDARLLDILCAPGFSTRDGADRASGRGVGMNVVKKAVEELGGSLSLATEAGQGARFTIQLPLTLAITDALIVFVGGQRFAVPQANVREVIEIEPSAVRQIEKNEIILFRGGALPVVPLARLFRLAEPEQQFRYAFVVGNGVHSAGIVVDRVVGLREIVVRATTDPLLRVPGIAGATELGDGKVVLILDAPGLLRERANR